MTREEAIKLVKRIKGAMVYTEEEKEALETLIPELAESEDDRIREIITNSVFYQYGAGDEYKDVLDYLDKLEKQKDGFVDNIKISASEDEKIRKELIGMVKFHCADEHLDRYLNWLEKRKENPKSPLKINKNIWHVCTRDVFIDGKPVYLKGDIVNSDDFLLVLDIPTAKAAFHRVWFPNNDEEKFCNAILHRNPDKQ